MGRSRGGLAGLLLLLGLAAILVLIAVAAFHGSDQTPSSSCSQEAAVLRHTTADTAAARRADSADGSLPSAALDALRRDGTGLTGFLQNQQSSDVGFDERALPVTDAITQLGTDPPSATTRDLGSLSAAVSSVDGYCGVPA